MRRVFFTVGATTLFFALGLTLITLRWVERENATEMAVLSERASVALDMQLQNLRTATTILARSHALVLNFDVETFEWEAKDVGEGVGAWVAFMAVDDLSHHIFNTHDPEKGSARTSSPAPELIEAVERSRKTGRAEVSDVFYGQIFNQNIFTVVKVETASTGQDYAVVLAVDAAVLSRDLEAVPLPALDLIGIIDGSHRVVGLSTGRISVFFLRPVPDWVANLLRNIADGKSIVGKGPGFTDALDSEYMIAVHTLQAAPTWYVGVGKANSNLALSSYIMLLPLVGSLLVFGIALWAAMSRRTSYSNKAALQEARERYEREQTLRADLEVALEKAHVAEAARGEMLAVLGHEMRTPVLSALAAIEISSETSESEKAGGGLGLAKRGLKALQSLIDDILDLARINSGEIHVEQAPVCLPALLDEVADIMKPMAERHRLSFECQWAKDGTTVLGDHARLRQILINFVSNAIRYTQKGSVTLTGEWSAVAEGKSRVRLCVSDTGRGIPEAKLAEVFQPYVRLRQGEGERIAGLGLGLPITERLARAMGGSIEAQSSVGQGSKFCLLIDLPIAQSHLKQKDDQEGAESSVEGFEGISVLLVEDHPLQAQIVLAVLEKLKAKAVAAATGAEALDAISRAKFDAVFVDLGLPDMGGVDLARQIRQAGSQAPLIVLSANPSSLNDGDRKLFSVVATKTANRKELQLLLQSALRRSALG